MRLLLLIQTEISILCKLMLSHLMYFSSLRIFSVTASTNCCTSSSTPTILFSRRRSVRVLCHYAVEGSSRDVPIQQEIKVLLRLLTLASFTNGLKKLPCDEKGVDSWVWTCLEERDKELKKISHSSRSSSSSSSSIHFRA